MINDTLKNVLKDVQLTPSKPLMLKFWDKECPACVEEIPTVNRLYAEWSQKVNIVGVCMNEHGVDNQFIKEKEIKWPQIALSWGSPLIEALNISQIPETVFIDEEGKVALFDLQSKIKTVLSRLHSTKLDNYSINKPVALIQPPCKIEVRDAGAKGAGVFAIENIALNEVIETCHIIEASQLQLNDYVFFWQDQENPARSKTVIPLGYGCIYNHSNNANATWRQHPTSRAFEFIATRDIQTGEEICTFYGGEEYWKARGIVPVE